MNRQYRSTAQCKTCPWRRAVDPKRLGGELGRVDPKQAREKCGSSGVMSLVSSQRQSCHRSPDIDPYACVGWLNYALGVGNNFAVRLLALDGAFDPSKLKLLGEQRESLDELVRDSE